MFPVVPFLSTANRFSLFKAVPKNFAMAGLEGWVRHGSREHHQAATKLQSQTTTSTPLASQWAAMGALEEA